MFKITPIEGEKRQAEAATICGTYQVPGAFAYQMIDVESGDLLGMSQFEIENGKSVLYDLRSAPGIDDFEAMFILGRQTLNFIDLCGVYECEGKDGCADARLLRCVGFKQDENGSWYCNTEGMFDGHCDGKTKELS